MDPSPSNTVSAERPVRLGVVSFVNTLPLIDGLDDCADVVLKHSVPSLLVDELVDGTTDVALCSSIDYQRAPVPLAVVPVGMLGCEGPTMTVRLYAKSPLESLETIHVDTDSHTSVVLLRLLLLERYGIRPEFIPYAAREHVADARIEEWPEAMLLIGDKVVTDSPPAVRYPHQLDLGEAWHDLTGLPFVFATWMMRADAPPARAAAVAALLDRQRRRNASMIDRLVVERTRPRGWPDDLARTYLAERLRFRFDDRARAGLERFWTMAEAAGAIESRRPLVVAPTDAVPATSAVTAADD